MTSTTSPTQTLNILIGDKLAPAGVELLKNSEGVHVDVKTGLSEDELASLVGEYDGMVIRSGVKVTPKVLEHPGRLKAVARAGVGVDNINLDAATKAGVLVMNSAEATTITTAEHAVTLMTALARNIGPAYKTMAEGGWDRNKFVGTQLAGKTVGIVGFGRIGQTVAQRALGFDMKVLAFDPVYNADTAFDGQVRLVKTFEELVPKVDFLTFHVPLNDHTRGMLNKDMFAKARPGLRVVNAARGGIIDEEALIEALDNDQCAGAALDVYDPEPLAEDSPLRTHPKILCTPHLGASTAEAQEEVSTAACEQLLEYLRGEGIRGSVNAAGVRLDLDPQQMKFVDLAQRMARLIAPMCEAGLSDVTVTIQGETLSSASRTLERMALVELLNSSLDVPVNVVNATVLAEQRKVKVRSVVEDEARAIPRLAIEVTSGDKKHRILGSVYPDGLPRVLEIDGYHMDMVPAGPIVMLHNEDRPGMIGMIGQAFGNSGANIADMALSRQGRRALTVLKLDAQPERSLLKQLREQPGIETVAEVNLPELNDQPGA